MFSATVIRQLPTRSDMLELYFLFNRDQLKNNKKSHIKQVQQTQTVMLINRKIHHLIAHLKEKDQMTITSQKE